MRHAALTALLILTSCGPAVNTGSREPEPDARMGSVSIYYYSHSTALERQQLDETLRLHMQLAVSWGMASSVAFKLVWHRDWQSLLKWKQTVRGSRHYFGHGATVIGIWDYHQNTLHVVATRKRTTSRHNGLAGLIRHVNVSDWPHSDVAWFRYHQEALDLDVRLGSQR